MESSILIPTKVYLEKAQKQRLLLMMLFGFESYNIL